MNTDIETEIDPLTQKFLDLNFDDPQSLPDIEVPPLSAEEQADKDRLWAILAEVNKAKNVFQDAADATDGTSADEYAEANNGKYMDTFNVII